MEKNFKNFVEGIKINGLPIFVVRFSDTRVTTELFLWQNIVSDLTVAHQNLPKTTFKS